MTWVAYSSSTIWGSGKNLNFAEIPTDTLLIRQSIQSRINQYVEYAAVRVSYTYNRPPLQ